jgi:predicted O-methyltransferase YrrM
MEFHQIMTELEAFGAENDRVNTDYARRMLNIPRETGQFLQVLVLAARAQRILEIGTSNGYSALWLARAASQVGGRVTTVERLEFKISLARANFARAGMAELITQVHSQARDFLERAAEASFDFIFLDSERVEYPRWWPHVKRILAPGGMFVVDNATSAADQLKPFFALVEADPLFTTSLVPIGKGEYVAVKGM